MTTVLIRLLSPSILIGLLLPSAFASDIRIEINRCRKDSKCLLKLVPRLEKELASATGDYKQLKNKSLISQSLLAAYETAGRDADAARIRPQVIVYTTMRNIVTKIACPDELCETGSNSDGWAAAAEYLHAMGPEYEVAAKSAERVANHFGRIESGSPSTAEIIAGAISQSTNAIQQQQANRNNTAGPSPTMSPSSSPEMCHDAHNRKYVGPCIECNPNPKPGERVMMWDSVLKKCVNGG